MGRNQYPGKWIIEKDGIRTFDVKAYYREYGKKGNPGSSQKRDYYLRNKETILARHEKYRADNPEKVKSVIRIWQHNNPERMKSYHQQYRFRLKKEVFDAYGNKCKCCGEKELEFLSVDHINGDGSKHRKEIGAGSKIYLWLKNHGFPQGEFRLLCMNCNWAKGVFGYCPHERRRDGENKEKL